MTITANDPFRSAPRISRDEFRRRINMHAAPEVIAERDAGAYWDVIVAAGVDPLFILAMFNHESTMGKYGMARLTHSWGNTRPPSFGVPHLSVNNNFSVYRDWLDGVKSTVARLASPEWVYSGQSRNATTGQTYGPRTAIRELFIHPSEQVWAPAGDNNDPNGYLNAVIRDMNAWADGGTPMTAQIPGFGWLPADRQHHTTGRTKRISGFAVHYTAGTDSRGWLTTNPNSDVSATFLIRHSPTLDERGWQLVRIEDTPHTTGGFVNPFTVSFEYEHDGRQSIPDAAYDVMAQTIIDTAAYVKAKGLGEIPLTRAAIKGHKEWVGDDRICPDGISVDRIVQRIGELTTPEPVDHIIVNGVRIRGGFRGHFLKVGAAVWPSDPVRGGIAVFGLPLAAEYPTAFGSAQRFERYMMEWHRDNAPPFDLIGTIRGEKMPERTP